MEQDNNQSELVDLSQVLNETGPTPTKGREDKGGRKIPSVYRLIMKLSGGVIKTEKQATLAAVFLIILLNIITFSLLFGGKDKTQSINQAQMAAPMAAQKK
ncbi:MAG: hypothetical protein WCQ96_02300 [Patescibacteria group bacterium]